MADAGVRDPAGRGRGRHDPPRPAEDERDRREAAHGGPRRRPSRPSGRDHARAVVLYGGERVFAAGADIKAMSQLDATGMRPGARADHSFTQVPDPQAGHRRDHRLCARRRLRAGAVRGLPRARRLGEDRPAGDPARRHPRRGRHPAAGPAGRAGEGQGHHLHRPARRRRGGDGDRHGRRRRPGRRGVLDRGGHGAKFAAGPPLALAAAKQAIDEGLELPIDEGLALESRLFAELFGTEDQKTGMRPSSRTARQGDLHRPLTGGFTTRSCTETAPGELRPPQSRTPPGSRSSGPGSGAAPPQEDTCDEASCAPRSRS